MGNICLSPLHLLPPYKLIFHEHHLFNIPAGEIRWESIHQAEASFHMMQVTLVGDHGQFDMVKLRDSTFFLAEKEVDISIMRKLSDLFVVSSWFISQDMFSKNQSKVEDSNP